ncbi:hypothetical protein V1478_003092 [Vespula squamosa]|uniref:Uncharacterized protein n=1 Tax=Vespula squamosa TaxID=30214 RepID=A0ABD2BRQ7_VESSQ
MQRTKSIATYAIRIAKEDSGKKVTDCLFLLGEARDSIIKRRRLPADRISGSERLDIKELRGEWASAHTKLLEPSSPSRKLDRQPRAPLSSDYTLPPSAIPCLDSKRGWKMENKIEKAILKRHGFDNFASETFHDIAGKVVKDLRDGSLRCETTKAGFQLP